MTDWRQRAFVRSLLNLIGGLVLGIGLVVSGITDTRRVQGFLDVFGNWDPTLSFVAVGAWLAMLVGWRVALRRHPGRQWLERFAGEKTSCGPALLIGTCLLGVSVGLVGFGAAASLAVLGLGDWRAAVFVVAMLVGVRVAQALAGAPDFIRQRKAKSWNSNR
ncbi:MAG: DUF6691 family protein [Burkholderiaceae bacterium]